MTDQPLAPTLAAHLAVSSPEAQIWRQVALGDLTGNEATDLLQARGPVDSGALERAKSMFAPLSPTGEQERLEALLDRMGQQRPDAPISLRTYWVTAVVALAASVLLFLVLVPHDEEDTTRFSAGYRAVVEKAVDDVRGAQPAEEIPRFRDNGNIAIWLKPQRAPEHRVSVVGFARNDAGKSRPLKLAPDQPRPGIMLIDTTVPALGIDAGDWELVFAVGRPDTLPSTLDDVDETANGYEVVRVRVVVETTP